MSPQDSTQQRHLVLVQATIQLKALAWALGLSLLLAFGCGERRSAGRIQRGWFAVGWGVRILFPSFIIGMLFGIPKHNDAATGGKQSSSQLTMNGNFAQISDWITKMITGVTLVSAKSVPGYVYRVGKYIGASFTGNEGTPGASVGSAIAVLFSGLGFIAGYLFTSIYLTVVLEDTAQVLNVVDAAADQMSSTDKTALLAVTDQMNPTEKQAIIARGAAPAQNTEQTTSAAEKLQDVAVDPSASADALELLGNAKMNFNKFDEAAQAFSAAIKKNGSRLSPCVSLLATALFRLKRNSRRAVETMRTRVPGPLYLEKSRGHGAPVLRRSLTFCTAFTCRRLRGYEKCILTPRNFWREATFFDPYEGIWINYGVRLRSEGRVQTGCGSEREYRCWRRTDVRVKAGRSGAQAFRRELAGADRAVDDGFERR